MENNLVICRSYAEEFTTDADTVCGDKKNLLLYGLTGLGKTHLSAAIAARLIRRGYDVVYETAINLFSAPLSVSASCVTTATADANPSGILTAMC